jgi:sulfatase maturation enzyme AslB (radical SAM superfamily)
MKLPGNVASLSNANAPVWVLFGVTSKGSVAAVKLFAQSLRSRFRQDLAQRSGRCLVPYFEAVYCVPENVDVSNFSFDSVQTVHFSVLRSRKDEATSDEFDWSELRHFVSETPGRVGLHVAHIDVVAACNFACSGCIEKALRNRHLYMSFSALIDILCRLKECGCCKVSFYGGEPTLHPHFPRLIDLAGNMGFEMVIVTNGSQLPKSGDLSDAIIRMQKMLQVRVSIDAACASTHSTVHGVIGKHVFDGIVRGTKRIIDSGVHVSISYLVRPSSVEQIGNISELRKACEFWRANGARQLSIRPMTLPGGSTPDLPRSDERKAVRDVLLTFGDFVSTPDWFRQWLFAKNEQCMPSQPKNYKTCYSAFYRVVISPCQADDHSREAGLNSSPKETENAWLSLCSYRRYDSRFGLFLPRNLVRWIQSKERVQYIERLNPARNCQNVLCCRDSYNRQIDDVCCKGISSQR